MIDKLCTWIVKKIKNKLPEIDEEKEEIIAYGIKLMFGEIPKMFILFGLSFLVGLGWQTIFIFLAIMPYRGVSGGFHLKSHLGCIIGTNLFYWIPTILGKVVILNDIQKYILIVFSLIFGIIMITLYAPADTENVPILRKKERMIRKILSYIFLSLTLIVAILIKEPTYANSLIFATILQTTLITKLAYRLTNNKFGYEIYGQQRSITKKKIILH